MEGQRLSVAYMEEFHEKEVNNDGIFKLSSEKADNRLRIELPCLPCLQEPHPKDEDVNQLVAGLGIRKINPAYSPIFEGARKCVQLIVESIFATWRQEFDIIEAGSAFEDLKVEEPIEFDFMLCERPNSRANGEVTEHDFELEGQFKNLVVERIYGNIDHIALPPGWSLYAPSADTTPLEKKYRPVGFQDHHACQMHKRGTKIWFMYFGQKILIDIVPCMMPDQMTQNVFPLFYRNSALHIEPRSAGILSFCHRTLSFSDENTLQAFMNNVSTSLLEKKILSEWPEEIKKLLRLVKLYCQTHHLISTNHQKPISDNKAYIDSYVLKTLFIRIMLEMQAKGITESKLSTISPLRFLCYFIRQLHGIFTDCQSKCHNSVEEYHVRFYHCFIAEKFLKRLSVKWRASDFKGLLRKCELLLKEFNEHTDQHGHICGKLVPCQMSIPERYVIPLELLQSPLWKLPPFDYAESSQRSITGNKQAGKARGKQQSLVQVVFNSNSKIVSNTGEEHKQEPFVSMDQVQLCDGVKLPAKPTYADVLNSQKGK